jgi:hypothetical protein
MADISSLGKWLMIFGVGVVILGALIAFAARVPGLNRLGNLPGDIHYTNPSGTFGCFVPIASSIILSIVLTVVLNLVIRLLNK